jgi:hypothetical protein
MSGMPPLVRGLTPVLRTSFIGWEHELMRLTELPTRTDVRLLTVTGPGGIGKSRLVLRVMEYVQITLWVAAAW